MTNFIEEMIIGSDFLSPHIRSGQIELRLLGEVRGTPECVDVSSKILRCTST